MNNVAALYDKHLRTVYGFFMAKTMHRQTAEDLTSDVFMTTLEQLQTKADRIQDPEKYLYGVMKLTWTQYLRRKYDHPVTYVENIEDFSRYVERELETFVGQSLAERAAPYIETLPRQQREVLTLRFLSGMSLSEICTHLGKDMNYVKTTQKRGLASLKLMVAGQEGSMS